MSSCLVIAPFGRENSVERRRSDEIYKFIVTPALQDTGYTRIIRTIDVGTGQPGEIARRVIRELRRADLVVADLSDSNPNVLYELALRHVTGRPYILLSRTPERLPFYLQGLNVIRINMRDVPGVERTKAELKAHITAIRDHRVDLQTPAFSVFQEDSTRSRVCKWYITYSKTLARDWLERQEPYVKEGITQWRQKELLPENTEVKRLLLEYLAYDTSAALRQRGELHYTIDSPRGGFTGYAVFDLPGSQTPAIRIHGCERQGSVIVEFQQPAREVRLGPGLSGEIRKFEYTITFRETSDGTFRGDFLHPDFSDSTPVLIGTSVLEPL